ncbi:hypothetical protein EJB05_32636 [Eragrostis curvula]|uniref:Uncharacterized protein n=1 Tax=Eragrostis curvula TaxID=38414 RepID=A0A5J9UGR1_9POAL|nr:hypothetical protein EJB05_32636 [Eragrostis curvula]
MESAEPAGKVAALEAELAAKSSRIAELEARVSLLEAENSRLRTAMAKGEAAGRTGEEDPIFGRLEEDLGGHKQTAAEKLSKGAGWDVLVLSDDEEWIAVDANEGRSQEEGVVAVPTTRKRGVSAVTGENENIEGGGEGNKGEARCDSDPCLEDDDVSVTAQGKKRAAARVVTSDSEDEDVNGSENGSGEEEDDKDEDPVTPGRKRALRGISDSENEDADEDVAVAGSKGEPHLGVKETEGEDEDDRIPISQVLKKIRKERVSDDDELSDAKGRSTSATRRSARLVKKRQAAHKALNFVEPKEYEGSEDDMEEDDDMDDFINDADSSEDANNSAEESDGQPEPTSPSARDEESSPKPDESDFVRNYKEVMDCIGRRKKAKDWNLEGEMLAAFREHPELCLKAVCALYRKQTKDEQLEKSALFHNKQGFSHVHATRASFIAEFLLDGDPNGPLTKTVDDLKAKDPDAFGYCQMLASNYSKQLFAIYQNKEDSYFHP